MQNNIFSVKAAGGVTEVFEIDTKKAAAHAAQEYTRELARQRQHRLASELSRLDAAEYQNDMLDHMLNMDAETLPDVESIDIQSEVQWFMRPYLLDFLTEAHGAFQLLPETLFLTVNLLDRYCSKRVVYKRHYQLVGCASLLIAAKYGDKKERVPTIQELKSMCCSIYEEDMFLQMEWHVLSTLGWTVGHPTVDSFLRLAVKDNVYDPEAENLALYILELAIFHRDFVSQMASTMALSALALSRHILGRPQARQNEFASQYCPNTVLDLSQKLHQPSNIVSRKYMSARYSSVARIFDQYLAQQLAVSPASSSASPVNNSGPKVDTQVCSNQFGFSTPQKPQPAGTNMAHGYPTPPETPEDEYFGMPQQKFTPKNLPLGHPTAPPTPSPTSNVPHTQFTFSCSHPDFQHQPQIWF
ncbi:MAG: hypothetical protein Q9227_004131 [Pyrenula ochraceoflavens]